MCEVMHRWLPQALYEFRVAFNEKICKETLLEISKGVAVNRICGFDNNRECTCFKYMGDNIWLSSMGDYYYRSGIYRNLLSDIKFDYAAVDEKTTVYLQNEEYIIPTIGVILEHFTPFRSITEKDVIDNLEELLNEYDGWEGIYDYDIGLIKQQAFMIVDQLAIIDANGHTQDISVRY